MSNQFMTIYKNKILFIFKINLFTFTVTLKTISSEIINL
jgi:hypothetical protein